MINQRLFGSPISGSVKKKLVDRQKVAGKLAFGESIEAVYPDKDGKNQADLSSRTPFARMWTSVKIIQPEQAAEVFETIDNPYKYYDMSMDEDTQLIGRKKQSNFHHMKVQTVQKKYPQSSIIAVTEKAANGWDERILKWIIKASDENEKGTRERMDFSRNIYIVGDNNYETAYGTIGPNDSITPLDDSTETSKEASKKLFPNELQKNDLFKPQAGITSVTSETEGTLGVIKKTTVNFVVHNFYDYDRIYNRYFLKPGAKIFVDFGWSSIKNLYKPSALITSSNIKEFINDDTDGIIPQNKGDLEVIQGLVTDYSSKILPNGSVECSVTLTSSNSALLGFETNEVDIRKIQEFLNKGVLYLGLKACLKDLNIDNNQDGEVGDIEKYLKTPNKDSSYEDIEQFNLNLKTLAKLELSSTNLTPKDNAVRTGIYIDNLTSDNIYISWGVIEDLILNAEFGFGGGLDKINKGKNLSIRFDSSYSFVTFNKLFIEKQRTLSVVSEPITGVLYPLTWGNSNTDGVSEIGEESYTYQNKKYPVSAYPENVEDYPTNEKSQMHYDKGKNRIPMRELFISTDIIMSAFNSHNTVIKIVKEILDEINKATDNVFNLGLTIGESESELRVVDNNRPEIQSLINASGVSDIAKGADAFANMFTFNIMSPNSIIKDYDLSFNLPQGNIGNMLAIQAMGNENKMFPISDMLDDAIAINALDKDALSIIYEPDNGSYRSEQIDSKNNSDSANFDIYQNVSELLSTDVYKASVVRSGDEINEEDLKKKKIQQKKIKKTKELTPAEKKKKNQDLKIQRNIDTLQFMGYKVVKNFTEYYKITETQEIKLKQRPNILPFTLSLTTYGIGSIVPGDTFRVDYLPQIYQKNVYLQTMKVINNINSSNWTTTLETQFRPLPNIKKNLYNTISHNNVRLSPKALINAFNLNKTARNNISKFKGYIPDLLPGITHLQVHNSNLEFVDIILSFKWVGVKWEQDTEIWSYGKDKKDGKSVYPIMFPRKSTRVAHIGRAFSITNYGYGYEYKGEDYKPRFHGEGQMPNYYFPQFPDEEERKNTYYLIIQGDYWAITDQDGDNNELSYYDFNIRNATTKTITQSYTANT